jgi:hypothetical protein
MIERQAALPGATRSKAMATGVAAFLDALPPGGGDLAQAVRDVVRRTVPHAEESPLGGRRLLSVKESGRSWPESSTGTGNRPYRQGRYCESGMAK